MSGLVQIRQRYPHPKSAVRVTNGRLSIRLSHTGWAALKDCAHSFELRYLKKVPSEQDSFYALPGILPGKQAETYFPLPVDSEARTPAYFDQTFDKIWVELTTGSLDPSSRRYVKWVQHGRRLAGDVSLPEIAALELAFTDRHTECRSTSASLREFVVRHGLQNVRGETEVGFDLKIEPEEGADEWVPILEMNGFIDIAITQPDGTVDVWDWKATKDPGKLDVDQLTLYSMALRARGLKIGQVGYFLIRQGKVVPHKIDEAVEFDLRKRLRQIGVYFRIGEWKPNLRKWKCPAYCDVRHSCAEAKKMFGAMK